jgi:23S rRNA U2552 (ribose-2'-O)-methylase RlmE/FtsJ
MENQISFLNEIIKKQGFKKSDTILDLGCDKHAPHKVELENLGFTNVIGIDIKPNINNLENYIQCNFLKDKLSEKLNLKEAGKNKAKLIYIFSPCFESYWWDLDVFFQNITENLDKDGVFLLDLFNYNSLAIGSRYSDTKEKDNKVVTANTQRLEDRYELEYCESKEGIKILESKGVWRIFKEQELEEILNKYNLIISNTYSDFTHEKGSFYPSNSSKRLIVKIIKLDIFNKKL